MDRDEAAAPSTVLNSWKEIAAYLGKDVRTVMRWEESRGLPVRRLPGGPKAGVYALQAELDQWRRGTPGSVPDGTSPPPPAGHVAHPPRRLTVILLAAGAAVVAASLLLSAWILFRRPSGTPAIEVTRLTYEESANAPTVSADGRLFAYVSQRGGNADIYLQQVGGRDGIRITHNGADNWQPHLSPDGSHVVFRSDREGGGLYISETVGGIERKIAERGSFPRFSPDATTVIYLVRDAFSARARVFTVPAEGGAPRPFQPGFVVPPIGSVFSVPMWSEDGKLVLFEGIRTGDAGSRGLWIAPVAGGPATRVADVPAVPRGKIRIYMAWSRGRLYYVEGTSVQGAPLYRVPLSPGPWRLTGEPQQLTSASTVCGQAAVSGEGRVVVAIVGSFVNSIWSVPLSAEEAVVSGARRQETPDAYNQMLMAVAANGSRFGYIGSMGGGRLEIRLADVATRRMTSVPLSADIRAPQFRLSRDGSRLGYRDQLDGKAVSHVVSATDPGRSAPFCRDCGVTGFFSNSADVLITDGARLARQDPRTGARQTLVEGPMFDAALSPDDRWLAFVAPRAEGNAALLVVPVREQAVPPAEWILVAEDGDFIGSPQWSPSGKLLYYASNRDSATSVWAQAFDASSRSFGAPVRVYRDEALPALKLSPGRSIGVTPDRLYMMMAASKSNVWTIDVDEK